MLLQFLHGIKWRALMRSIIISQDSLVPRPLPLRRVLVLTVCTCTNNYVTFSVKALCTYLVCMWKIILTKNTELSRFQQRFNLQNPARILLFRCGSIIFPKLTLKQKDNKLICQKGQLIATETLISLCTQLVAAPP